MAKATPGKSRTAYVCAEWGASFSKWQGQCGECGAWNSLSEIVVESAAASPAARRGGWAGKADAPKATALKDVRHSEEAWVSTGIGEFDQKQGSKTGKNRGQRTIPDTSRNIWPRGAEVGESSFFNQ